MRKRTFYLLLALAFSTMVAAFGGCTKQIQTRSFGGSSRIDILCGNKLFDLTWKDSDLWYAIRPMKTEETPSVYIFSESSSFGLLEGTVFSMFWTLLDEPVRAAFEWIYEELSAVYDKIREAAMKDIDLEDAPEAD